MAKKPSTRVISTSVSEGRQSVTSQDIFAIGAHKIRLTIKSDSYDFQSSAVAEVWNGATLSWNRVHSIPYKLMKTRAGLIYVPKSEWMFGADQVELMRVVQEVLA